jgi:N4-gp56 family major capsid protein
MPGNTYLNPTGRINEVKGEFLAMAEPVEVLMLGVTPKKFPKNKGDNISYARVIPAGGATTNANTINRWSVSAPSYLVAEGVTPTAKALTYQHINVALSQYAVLYSYTDKVADLHEDDIPADQQRQVAHEMGLVREMIRYGEMKGSGATTVQYSGGTSLVTVDEAITYNGLSLMSRTLQANGAAMKTTILAPGPAYDTSAIEAGFVVFVHTDAEHDIRQLQDFVPVAKYASRKPISPHELGSVGRFRFITSKELAPTLAGGAAVGSTGLESVGGSNIDVYPFIVVAEDAVFDIGLNLNFDVTHIPAKTKTKEDPFGQRGYVGASFWSAAKVVNAGWMGVIWAGVSDL